MKVIHIMAITVAALGFATTAMACTSNANIDNTNSITSQNQQQIAQNYQLPGRPAQPTVQPSTATN